MTQRTDALWEFRLWMPGVVYPAFKRLASKRIYSATFHRGWARVTLR